MDNLAYDNVTYRFKRPYNYSNEVLSGAASTENKNSIFNESTHKIVEKYKLGNTKIKICDEAYINKTEKEIKFALDKCAELASKYMFIE